MDEQNTSAGTEITNEVENTTTFRVCGNCGATLSDGQTFCGNCGQYIDYATDLAPSAATSSAAVKKSKAPIIIGCAIAAMAVIGAVILVFVLMSRDRFDFNKEYSDIRLEEWCTIGEDGTWMKLDTNPNDVDTDDMTYTYLIVTMKPCLAKIEEVNADLGFSSVVIDKMNTTTVLDGRQTESNDNFIVSWIYGNGRGLEVTYEVKNK